MIGIFDVPRNCSGKVANDIRLGKRIRAARLARDVTEKRMAECLKIPEEQYRSIERNDSPDIDASMLEKIMKLLLCSWMFLCAGTKPASRISLYTLDEAMYICSNRTDELTTSDLANSIISINQISMRINEMSEDNNISIKELKMSLTPESRDATEGTFDIIVLKRLARKLKCSWQYLAGLSMSRFTKDIQCVEFVSTYAPDIISNFLLDTFINEEDIKPARKFICTFVGQRIADVRSSNNESQTNLANFLNVSHQMVSKIESGNVDILNSNQLKKIASFLKCTKEYLFGVSNNREGTGIYSLDFFEIKVNSLSHTIAMPLPNIEAVLKPENADIVKLVYEISQLSQENRSKILKNLDTSLALVRKNQK